MATLIVGVNSYIDVASADTYFEDRLGATNWLNATPELKSSALIQATRMIDCLFTFEGMKTIDTQSLAFPRRELYDKYDVLRDSLTIPVEVEAATAEQALYLIITNSKDTNESSKTPQIKKAILDVMEVEYFKMEDSKQDEVGIATCVDDLLDQFKLFTCGNNWCSGITVRN